MKSSQGAVRSWTIGAIVYLLGDGLWSVLQTNHPYYLPVVDLLQILAPLISAYILAVVLRERKEEQYLWGGFFLSALCYAGGMILWAVDELVLQKDPTIPGFADIIWMFSYLSIVGSLTIAMYKHRQKYILSRFLLDSVILIVAAGSLLWKYLLGPTLAAMATSPFWYWLIDVSYPVVALLILLGAAMLTHMFGVVKRVPAYMLLYACLLLFFGESWYLYLLANDMYQTGHWVDLFWTVTYFLFALAGLHQIRDDEQVDQPEGKPNETLRYLPIGVVLVVAIMIVSEHDVVIDTVMIFLAILAIYRQMAAVADAQKSRERISSLMLALPVRLLVLTRDGVITGHKDMDDIIASPENKYNQSINHVLPVSLAHKIFWAIGHILSGGKRTSFEYPMVMDIKTICFDVQVVPCGEEILVVFHDITSQKQDEIERERYREHFARNEKLVALGILSASIAHEINQPLNAIKVTAQSGAYFRKMGRTVDAEQLLDDMGVIQEQANRIDQIIKQTRALTKGEADRNERVNLVDVINQSVTLIREKLAASRVRLCIEMESDAHWVQGTALQWGQVLLNLTNNAIQALDNVVQADKVITIRLYEQNGVVLEIADNGPGIPEEMKERVFDAFISTKNTGENMGMGLAVVASIVTNYHGRISCFNNPDGGATFQVWINPTA